MLNGCMYFTSLQKLNTQDMFLNIKMSWINMLQKIKENISCFSWIINSTKKWHFCLLKSRINHERMTLTMIFQFSSSGVTSLRLWPYFWTSHKDITEFTIMLCKIKQCTTTRTRISYSKKIYIKKIYMKRYITKSQ